MFVIKEMPAPIAAARLARLAQAEVRLVDAPHDDPHEHVPAIVLPEPLGVLLPVHLEDLARHGTQAHELPAERDVEGRDDVALILGRHVGAEAEALHGGLTDG